MAGAGFLRASGGPSWWRPAAIAENGFRLIETNSGNGSRRAADRSAVPNRVDEVSCSINDLIADEQVWPSHGHFIQHVNRVVRDLVSEGLIDRKEAAAVRRAAAHSDVGR